MKKTLVSLAAASLIVTSAMAADKGIDIVTTGQAVIYYNTAATSGGDGDSQDLFGTSTEAGSADNTRANYGIQLNLDADLKNGFTFGSTINYLGTAGLEKNLVTGVMQGVDTGIGTDDNGDTVNTANGIADEIYLAQLYVAKKVGNTTIKIGRQELPKSLSPFAFSEGWNVFKNTFDAILAVNTDIPDTTLVGAYVSGGNGNGFGHNMGTFDDLAVNKHSITGNGGLSVQDTAYLLTVQNKSIPMATVTASYYDLARIATLESGNDGATILWGDVAIASKDFPMGLKVGIQGGQISTETSTTEDTTAYGVKVGLKPVDALALCLAYTSVNDGTVVVQNAGGVKSPLYTQMIANQGAIKIDNNTIMLKGVYNAGDYGKVILQATYSDDTRDDTAAGVKVAEDFTDIELVYKFKAANINFLAAYINQSWDEQTDGAADTQDIVRVVARYAF